MAHQLVIVLDFGGQYNQLIARRVRECGVYCEVHPYKTPISKLREMNPVGIIFTGGPNSVYLETSPTVSKEIFEFVDKSKKLPKTSAVSPDQFKTHFENLKKDYAIFEK